MNDDYFRTHDFGTIIGSCRMSQKMCRWGFLIPYQSFSAGSCDSQYIPYRLGSCHLGFLDESSFARDTRASKNSADLKGLHKKSDLGICAAPDLRPGTE